MKKTVTISRFTYYYLIFCCVVVVIMSTLDIYAFIVRHWK